MARTVSNVVFVTWEDVEHLTDVIANQLLHERFDLFLGICRGGLIPLGLLADRFGVSGIVTASIQNFDQRNLPLPKPIIVHFPPASTLAGKRILVVGDVWDSGRTMTFARKAAEAAGATAVKTATLYFKRNAAKRNGRPDFYADETDLWVVYPWEHRR